MHGELVLSWFLFFCFSDKMICVYLRLNSLGFPIYISRFPIYDSRRSSAAGAAELREHYLIQCMRHAWNPAL